MPTTPIGTTKVKKKPTTPPLCLLQWLMGLLGEVQRPPTAQLVHNDQHFPPLLNIVGFVVVLVLLVGLFQVLMTLKSHQYSSEFRHGNAKSVPRP